MRRAAALWIVLAALAAAQEPPPQIPRAGEVIDVSIASFDVVVTDRKGNRVTGLSKNDFEIVEDGEARPVTNFTEYRDETGGGSQSVTDVRAAEASPAPRQRRAIVVFVDDMKLPPFKKDPVFEQLRRTLHEIVRPGDLVLVARWRLKLIVEQANTSDLALIDQALARASDASSGAQVDAITEIRNRQSDFVDMMAEIAEALGEPVVIADDDPFLMFDVRNSAQLSMWDMKEKINALTSIIAAMPPEAKKALVMLSNRTSAMAGGEFFYGTGQTQSVSPEDRRRFDTRRLREKLVRAASARGVPIYAFFPEGLQNGFEATVAMSDQRMLRYQGTYGTSAYLTLGNELGALGKIADDTGGTMAWSSVAVAKALPSIKDDLTSYYSLAYRVPARRDDRPHAVVVRTKNRAYAVRTRKQFIDRSPQAEMRDRVVAALFGPAPPSQIVLDVGLGNPVKKSKGIYTIPTDVRIPIASLMTVPDGEKRKGAFTIYVTAKRAVGFASQVHHQTVPFVTGPGAQEGHFTYHLDLLTDLLSTRIAIAIVDEVSRDSGYITARLPQSAPR